MAAFNIRNFDVSSKSARSIQTSYSSDMENMFADSPIFTRLKNQVEFLSDSNIYEFKPSAFHLMSQQMKETVWELLNLDSRERSSKVVGRERYVAVLDLLKGVTDGVRADRQKIKLSILEALRVYPKKHGSQSAASAIGRVFGHEFRLQPSEHPYNKAEVAAEALANIHAYPKGPIGVTNARIFEAQIQDCMEDSAFDLFKSPELKRDRDTAQARRIQLMECRDKPLEDQTKVIDKSVRDFVKRLEDLKKEDKPDGFVVDRDTITWQGCIRGSKDDPMGHAYVTTFHVLGKGSSARVFMKVSDSGDLGKTFMQRDGDSGSDRMIPRILEIDMTKQEELKALIREMSESTVFRDVGLSKRSAMLQKAVKAATISRPELPPEMTTLRQEVMKKMDGNYCVSWSHMHNMQSRYAMKSNHMLRQDRAAQIVSDLSMILYRHELDQSLLKESGHAAQGSTLRDIVHSAQFSMATEARGLLEEWQSMTDDQKETTDSKFDPIISEVIGRATEFGEKYKVVIERIEGDRQEFEYNMLATRPEEYGALRNIPAPLTPVKNVGQNFSDHIFEAG